MLIQPNETLENRGTVDLQRGTLILKDGIVPRSALTEDELTYLPVLLTDLRVHDAIGSPIPAAAADDDLGLISGTFGTDAPTVQTSDAKATTVTQRLRFKAALGPEYVAGHDVKLRITAGMITTVSDGTATVDVECYKDDGDGGISADLCATAAQDMNNLTKADYTFTITATNLEAGDVLDFRVTIAITDGATGTAVIGEISAMGLLEDIKG